MGIALHVETTHSSFEGRRNMIKRHYAHLDQPRDKSCHIALATHRQALLNVHRPMGWHTRRTGAFMASTGALHP